MPAVTSTRPAFGSAIVYKDPLAALRWLEAAFGFETAMLITDEEGRLAHSEMTYGGGYIMVGNEWTEQMASPKGIGGKNTQTVHVQLREDVDAHCDRARKAGAVILQEPQTQFYGDRTYRAVDPEGHMWTFGQSVRDVSREEAEEASGLKIEGWT
jgi:uncharacterized glyoxalase superfamily protein PhnB